MPLGQTINITTLDIGDASAQKWGLLNACVAARLHGMAASDWTTLRFACRLGFHGPLDSFSDSPRFAAGLMNGTSDPPVRNINTANALYVKSTATSLASSTVSGLNFTPRSLNDSTNGVETTWVTDAVTSALSGNVVGSRPGFLGMEFTKLTKSGDYGATWDMNAYWNKTLTGDITESEIIAALDLATWSSANIESALGNGTVDEDYANNFAWAEDTHGELDALFFYWNFNDIQMGIDDLYVHAIS